MKTDSTKEMMRVKVGADESIRVTIGNVGAVINKKFLEILCRQKELFSLHSEILSSVTMSVIEKMREGEETFEAYRDTMDKVEILGQIRDAHMVISSQQLFERGREVVADDAPADSGEADEDTAAEE